jgi:AcrR family transcriptional regulator
MATTRDLLIDTMKQLLWERGYDATSPNLVLERSGVGKGSFYHHFKGKKDLAIAAMDSRADELIAEFQTVITTTEGDWLNKVSAYLRLPRSAIKGCRMGRVVQDPSLEDALLKAPLERYFEALHRGLSSLYASAQENGELEGNCQVDHLASATLSVLQGGFVLGRALSDEDAVTQACESFIALLRSQKCGDV